MNARLLRQAFTIQELGNKIFVPWVMYAVTEQALRVLQTLLELG